MDPGSIRQNNDLMKGCCYIHTDGIKHNRNYYHLHSSEDVRDFGNSRLQLSAMEPCV